jgi:hypothetical protein
MEISGVPKQIIKTIKAKNLHQSVKISPHIKVMKGGMNEKQKLQLFQLQNQNEVASGHRLMNKHSTLLEQLENPSPGLGPSSMGMKYENAIKSSTDSIHSNGSNHRSIQTLMPVNRDTSKKKISNRGVSPFKRH